MPVRNHFPVFHKLKSGAYSYVWTDKCEKLLPEHYKKRCLEYMLKEPKPIHWIPDTRKYEIDQYGNRLPVQNHPVHVKYPVQCNYGLWAGEGIIQYWSRNVYTKKYEHLMTPRVAKYDVPHLVNRTVYSEILDKWLQIPCTNRAMDLIDDAFGLDNYILQTHERDLNSKLGMDLKRKMLLRLCKDASMPKLSLERQKVFDRYKQFMIPKEEAEWVGLSIAEALEKAETNSQVKNPIPLKYLIAEQYLKELKDYNKENKDGDGESNTDSEHKTESADKSKSWFRFPKWGKKSQKQAEAS